MLGAPLATVLLMWVMAPLVVNAAVRSAVAIELLVLPFFALVSSLVLSGSIYYKRRDASRSTAAATLSIINIVAYCAVCVVMIFTIVVASEALHAKLLAGIAILLWAVFVCRFGLQRV
jgi:hypothetical protein